MKINLYIERFVLDSAMFSEKGGQVLAAAMETELVRLLAGGRPSADLQSDASPRNTTKCGIRLDQDGSPARLGKQIASAVSEQLSR